MTKSKLLIENIDIIIFDFDGVLTNNLVYINENGIESVVCHRSDGLAFDVLHKLNIKTMIISTEKNKVVTARAKKLNTKIYQGIRNKADTLISLFDSEGIKSERALYIGNDLNDYNAIKLCGYSVCPADSHKLIKQIATLVLKTNGGNGVVRELIEDVFGIDVINTLY